jgi:hypothetical protein
MTIIVATATLAANVDIGIRGEGGSTSSSSTVVARSLIDARLRPIAR